MSKTNRKGLLFIMLLNMMVVLVFSNETHEVKKGETVYQLAQEYGIPVEVLLQVNKITNPSAIPEGKTLTIPDKKTTYKVEKGDTLYGIAHDHKLTLRELKDLNKSISDNIYVGQEIIIATNKKSVSKESNDDTAATATVASKNTRDADLGTFNFLNSSDLTQKSRFIGKVSNNWPISGNGYVLNGKLPGMLIEGDENSNVKATQSGVVIYAALHTTFSNVVVIQGDDNLVYVYAGQNALYVKQGDRVNKGSIIGSLGIMPTLQKPYLYFAMWDQDQAIDPRKLING